MKYIFLLIMSTPLLAETDLYLPWAVTNDTFTSKIVINNYGDEIAMVSLNAIRADGESESAQWEILPSQTFVADSVDHFPSVLGLGSGYSVRITSDAEHISASVIVQSKTTESGDSPSQINAIPITEASHKLAFNFMPTNTEGFAAPVITNTGAEKATVTFRAMQDGQEVAHFQTELATQHVFAMTSSDMFPDLIGDIYILAESDQPLVGTSFVFNDLREPSMAQAIPLKTPTL